MPESLPLPLPRDRRLWALFLDIDGTLVDIAARPDAVVVPASLPPLLDALSARLSGALALVSGRELSAVDHLFPGGRDAAGAHGAECRIDGRTEACGGIWPDHLARALAEVVDRHPGLLAERKTRSLSIHFRDAPAMAGTALELGEGLMAASPAPLRMIHGKAVVEIIPAGAGKGRAIERFMAHPSYSGRVPVFIGDDITDEEGFLAVNRLGGVTIHVGSAEATTAALRLPSPASVRQWLAKVNEALEGAD